MSSEYLPHSIMNESFNVGNLEHILQHANHVFPLEIFDRGVRKDCNIETPLLTSSPPHYDKSGCYVFFEPEQEKVIYVGKSKTLRNRITNHWGNYFKSNTALERFFNFSWSNDLPFSPQVAIFLSDGDLMILESYLKALAKPIYNRE